MSSVPNLKAPVKEIAFDKFFHVLEYIPFGILVTRALILERGINSIKKVYFCAFTLSFLYGLSDEVHQLFVAGRYCSWGDIVADCIGGIFGIGLYIFLRNRLRTVKKQV